MNIYNHLLCMWNVWRMLLSSGISTSLDVPKELSMGTLILRSLAGPDCPFMGWILGGARKFTWVQEQLATMGRFSYFPAGVKTDHSLLHWGCKYATLTLSRNSSTKIFVVKNHFQLILHYKIKIMLEFPLISFSLVDLVQ